MAITCTPAQVRPLKGAQVRRKQLALACAAGVAAAIANDARITPADKDTAPHGRGIVLADGYGSTSFQVNQTVDFVVHGPVGGYAGMTPGAVVYVGDDGGLTLTAPSSLACAIGYAEDASTLFVQPQAQAPVA